MIKCASVFTAVILALVCAYVNQEDGRLLSRINNNCRNRKYPRSPVFRLRVPDDKVLWDVTWVDYNAPYFTEREFNNEENSDSGRPGVNFHPRWNEYDNDINRISFCGNYSIVNSLPLNPIGRTGVSGRGLLPKWGPNHWVNLIITRHKRNADNNVIVDELTNKPILEIIGIRGHENILWAVPGRIVHVGESLSSAAKRIYYRGVGTVFNLRATMNQTEMVKKRIDGFLEHGKILYQGYVDDPKNTDNAWVETTVLHFHDETGDFVANIPLYNSDRVVVQWLIFTPQIRWILRHYYFMENITESLLRN